MRAKQKPALPTAVADEIIQIMSAELIRGRSALELDGLDFADVSPPSLRLLKRACSEVISDIPAMESPE